MLEARTPAPRRLRDDRVDVWYTWTDPLRDDRLLARYERVLSDEERARRDRFVFDKDAHVFLVAHALVRSVLSCYRELAPEAWRFVAGPHGKPEVEHDPGEEGLALRFNLSHTTGLVACAVAAAPVGVDVEWIERNAATSDVAERSFARDELAQLEGLDGEAYRDRFFDFWTLKEALIKADGRGISMGLDRFAFALGEKAPPSVAFDASLDEDPERWSFWQDRPGPVHRGAVAVKRAGRPQLRLFRTVPFA